MKATVTFACLLTLGGALTLFADSHAYVFASGAVNGPDTLNSITPFNIAKLTFGQDYFVPPNAGLVAVAPGTGEVWETTTARSVNQCGINILDPKSGATLATVPFTSCVVDELIFDKGGDYAYALMSQASVVKIDVATRTVVQTLNNVLPQPLNVQYGLAISGDGTKLVVMNNGLQLSVTNSLVVIDTKSMSIQATFSPGYGISMLVRGNTLVVCTSNKILYYDLTTLKQIYSGSVPPHAFLIDLSPDGSKIYLGIGDVSNEIGSLQILDFFTGTVLTSRSIGVDGVPPIVVAPDGSELLVLGSTMQILDANTLATTNAITGPRTTGPGAGGVAFADSETLLILHGASAIMVVEQASAQLTTAFPVAVSEVSDSSVAATRRGSTIFVGGEELVAVDTALNQVVQYFPVSPFNGNLGFDPDALVGDQLYGFFSSGEVLAYNLSTATETALPGASKGSCSYCAVSYLAGEASPNGATYWVPFISSFSDHLHKIRSQGVVVYSTATNSIAGQIALPNSQYNPIAFSPDSSTAYVGVNNNILVYDTATLQNTATYTSPAMVRALAISPYGSVLFAASGSYIFVIDAATGAQKGKFVLPDSVWTNLGVSMAISPDGTALFLTDNNKNMVDMVDTTTGQVTQVAVPYAPTGVVVVP